MPELVTLDQFGAAQRHYHVYRITSTALDHLAHYHDYYQVCYIVSGEIIHRQGDESVALSAGDAFIVPPGFIHSLHFNNTRSEMFSLSFVQTLFAPGFPQSNAYRFLENLGAQQGELVRLRLQLDAAQRQSVENLMACLIRQQETPCPDGLSAAPSLVAAMLYLLSQSYYYQPENASLPIEASDYSSTLACCIRYVDQHYREALTPEELARQFGLSRSVFYSVFARFAGAPFRQYIAQKRVTEAQVLIRAHPNRPIGQIAAQVGYRDDSTFYRNFLHITGVTPSKYKSLLRHPTEK